jgi:hypothetical protein
MLTIVGKYYRKSSLIASKGTRLTPHTNAPTILTRATFGGRKKHGINGLMVAWWASWSPTNGAAAVDQDQHHSQT